MVSDRLFGPYLNLPITRPALSVAGITRLFKVEGEAALALYHIELLEGYAQDDDGGFLPVDELSLMLIDCLLYGGYKEKYVRGASLWGHIF